MNDYGFELLSAEPVDLSPVLDGTVFATNDLLSDVLASLNATELSQRRFREIARVAGLVFTGYPRGAGRPSHSSARSGRPWRPGTAGCCTPPPGRARPMRCGWGP